MDIAVVGVALFLTLSPDKKFKEVKNCSGGGGSHTNQGNKAEAILSGKSVSQKIIETAADKAAAEARPISDLRSSGDYRRELVKVLTHRTLQKSCEELGIKIIVSK